MSYELFHNALFEILSLALQQIIFQKNSSETSMKLRSQLMIIRRKFGLSNLTSITVNGAVEGAGTTYSSSKKCSTALTVWGYLFTGWLLLCLFACFWASSVNGKVSYKYPTNQSFITDLQFIPKVLCEPSEIYKSIWKNSQWPYI